MFADTDVTVFVQRDQNNKIIGVFRRPQPVFAEEEMLASNQEVVDFEAQTS